MILFRLMVKGCDDAGSFYVVYVVAAETRRAARDELVAHSTRSGWRITAWEEEEEMGPRHDASVPGLVSESGRAYFDASD